MQDLMQFCGEKFTLKTAIMIAFQVIISYNVEHHYFYQLSLKNVQQRLQINYFFNRIVKRCVGSETISESSGSEYYLLFLQT
jgi:hypothetical protein